MTEPLWVIGDGQDKPDKDVPEGLNDKDLIELFRWLVLLRTFDERAVALQRQGRLGTYALYWGEEGTQAGPLYACEDSDWVFPSYRQNSIGMLRGVSPATVFAWWRGYGGTLGFWNPREHRVAPICVPIGTHIPHAVGLSWAAKMRRSPTASLVWFGDGATSEGDFHEAMNFAAVFRTPTVFFCVNNQWAISTPVEKQTATKTLAEKASAYAIPASRVDGFDPLACYQATKQALEACRRGEGPVFVEAYCYRIGAHGTADDPRLYRDEADAKRWRSLEPLGRYESFLTRLGILTGDQAHAIKEEAKTTIASAVRAMEAMQQPAREVLFEHVYASGRVWTFEDAAAELETLSRPPEVKPLGPQPGPSTGDAEAPKREASQ